MQFKNIVRSSALTLGISIGAIAPCMGGSIYLKIPNVNGPVTRQGLAGAIELTAYSQGFTNSVSLNSGGGNAGKASCGAINISKLVDSTSQDFLEYVTRGTTVKTLDVYFTGNNPNTTAASARYKIVLTNVRVTSLTQGDTASDARGLGITENVSLIAERFQITYVTQTPDGSTGNTETYGWDCATNSAL